VSEFLVSFSGNLEYPKYARLLLVGQPGVGKTSVANSFPNPFWVNAAAGMTTLARFGNVPYINYSTESDLFALKEFLDSGNVENSLGRKVETLVIDSIDELQRLLLVERLKNERRSEVKLDDYGWLNSRMHSIIAGIMQLNLNVVLISHTKEVSVGSDTLIKPALAGQFCEHIHNYVDMSLMMHARTISDQPVEDVQILGMKTSASISAHDDLNVDRWIVTTPQAESEWVNDKTGKLPNIIDLANENFFDVISSALSNDTLAESTSIIVQPSPEVIEDDVVDIIDSESEEISETKLDESESVEICSECSSEITQKTWSDLSKMRFGVSMCGNCFKKKG